MAEVPFDAAGMPVVLQPHEVAGDPETCVHAESVEVGHGMAFGRSSNGNEKVSHVCAECGAPLPEAGEYFTGGVV